MDGVPPALLSFDPSERDGAIHANFTSPGTIVPTSSHFGSNPPTIHYGKRFSYLELFTNKSVEETDVGIPEPGQEDVLLNVRRLAPELGEGALLLEVKGLDLGGTEAVKAEGIPELGRSRSAW